MTLNKKFMKNNIDILGIIISSNNKDKNLKIIETYNKSE